MDSLLMKALSFELVSKSLTSSKLCFYMHLVSSLTATCLSTPKGHYNYGVNASLKCCYSWEILVDFDSR